MNEHLDLKKPNPMTAVKQHILECEICQNSDLRDSFEILKNCSSDFQSKIYEAFFIKKLSPTLNSQMLKQGRHFY